MIRFQLPVPLITTGAFGFGKRLLGEDWMKDYVAKANRGGIERVLL